MRTVWRLIRDVFEIVFFGVGIAVLATGLILFFWLAAVGFFYLFGMLGR